MGDSVGTVITGECRYGTMSFLRHDLTIGRSLRDYGEWAQAEVDSLLRGIPPGGMVWDVGANVGTHTLAFARRVGPSGRVYAFEPQRTLFELLRTNVERNGLSGICRLLDTGLADAPGEMVVPTLDYARPSHPGGVALLPASPGSAGERVRVTTLDLCRPDACDLIKVDVEGMELQVLTGARATLSRFRPLVSIECWSVEAGWPNMCLMRDLGYRTFACSFPGFNPSNYRLNPDDWFHGAGEPALLFVPEGRVAAAEGMLAGLRGEPVESREQLRLALSPPAG